MIKDIKNIYEDPYLAAERALEYSEEGFTAVKFDPVGPYTIYDPRQLSLSALFLSEQFVSKIRKSLGNRCDILFGTHGQMTSSSAVRLAKNSTKLLCGAGIVSGNDVSRAKDLGSKGILVASGIIKSKNWEKIIDDFSRALI